MAPPLRHTVLLLALYVSTAMATALAQDIRQVSAHFQVEHRDVLLNSYRFQSGIQSERGLGPLTAEHSTAGEQVVTFDFGAKSDEARFFLLGTLYAEATAYLHSGDLTAAAKRLAAIETECIRLHVSPSLYTYVSSVHNMLVTERYDAAVLGDFLALLQPLLDDYALSQGAGTRTLFRAGTWLVDMSLAAAAQDKALLQQVPILQYFADAMQRLAAPQGVIDALKEMTNLLTKAELSDQDVTQVLTLVKKVQTILG